MPHKRSNTFQGRKIRTGPRGGKYILKGGQKRYLSGGQACAMGGKGRCKKSKTDDGNCYMGDKGRCRKKKKPKAGKKVKKAVYTYSSARQKVLKEKIKKYANELADPSTDTDDPNSRILSNDHFAVLDNSYMDRNFGMSVDDIVFYMTNFMKNFNTKYRHVAFEEEIGVDPFMNDYKVDLGTMRQWKTEERDWEIIKLIMENAASYENFYIEYIKVTVDEDVYGDELSYTQRMVLRDVLE